MRIFVREECSRKYVLLLAGGKWVSRRGDEAGEARTRGGSKEKRIYINAIEENGAKKGE